MTSTAVPKEIGKFLSIAIMIALAILGVVAVAFMYTKFTQDHNFNGNERDLVDIAGLALNAAGIAITSVFLVTFGLTFYNIFQMQQQRKEIDATISRDEDRIKLLEERLRKAETEMSGYEEPDAIIKRAQKLVEEAKADIIAKFNSQYVPADTLGERLKREVELEFVERIYKSALGSTFVAEAMGRPTAEAPSVPG